MNENTQKALELLNEKKAVLVLCKEGDIQIFEKDSIKSLVSLCDSGKDYYGYSCAIKSAGRAAAFLLVNLEVTEVYAVNLQKLAVNVLDRAEIAYTAENKFENFSEIADEGAPEKASSEEGSCTSETTEFLEKIENAVVRSGSALVALQDIRRALS